MIQFVDLRDRLEDHRFALWQTSADRFLSFDHEYAWDTKTDLEEAMQEAKATQEEIRRIVSLLPNWTKS